MVERIVIMHKTDNVALMRNAAKAGDLVNLEPRIIARSALPAMHKVALKAIATGEPVQRYGQTIGMATADIEPGDHVHSHNLTSVTNEKAYDFCAGAKETVFVSPENQRTFQGYRRPGGKVGTRNYIGLVTSVNCSATVARHIAAAVEKAGLLDNYPEIDGIVPIVHSTGCGMSDKGEGFETIRRVLAGYAAHPNFGGVMLIGLGCEIMQVRELMAYSGLADSTTFKHFIIQEAGGTRKTINAGLEALKAMLPAVNASKREPVPISELTLALQCGGSDAYSGLTANPALGKAVDRLVAHGGTAILSETPEIYGAEHLLSRRAVTQAVGRALLDRIAWWKDYTAQRGDAIDNNPSPGNKAGGLTTILEKSLGAQAKGGSTNLMGVFKYGEPITAQGLVFMDSPGYDPMSVTGQVASGATVVCFTTGRGSAFGFKPSPTLKLASNSALFERQGDDMDINCGPVADGDLTLDQMGDIIFDKVIAIASGELTKSEEFEYGDCEFVPWQIHANL